MILHNQVGDFSGAHAFSIGGIAWDLARTPAYTLKATYYSNTQGKKVRLGRREEPKLLFLRAATPHTFSTQFALGVANATKPLRRPFWSPSGFGRESI
jgi:hypothetical protein